MQELEVEIYLCLDEAVNSFHLKCLDCLSAKLSIEASEYIIMYV